MPTRNQDNVSPSFFEEPCSNCNEAFSLLLIVMKCQFLDYGCPLKYLKILQILFKMLAQNLTFNLTSSSAQGRFTGTLAYLLTYVSLI